MKDLLSISRRDFMRLSAVGTFAVTTGSISVASDKIVSGTQDKPNILLIITDQQALKVLSYYGFSDVSTPNLDKLAASGASFKQSYCTYPLCSPSRSSMFTSRMPSETGVLINITPIRPDIPNLGQVLSRQGYDSYYAGKWHLPYSYMSKISGFDVIPVGEGYGSYGDSTISRACEGLLSNRTNDTPFLLVASFMQPHDICEWASMHAKSKDLEISEISSQLPKIPSNFKNDPYKEPEFHQKRMKRYGQQNWNKLKWRNYLWSYYRMVEQVDAEIGRLLKVVKQSDYADNTMIVFTSDHGEGIAEHQIITKQVLYDTSVKVPFIISFPGRIPAGTIDDEHLVSGLDILPTICDYAGVAVPKECLGRTLKPIAERKKNVQWRDFLVTETNNGNGRMLRTKDYKYIIYYDDKENQQFFDMKNDPGETKNQIDNPEFADKIKTHRRLLEQWEANLDKAGWEYTKANCPKLQ